MNWSKTNYEDIKARTPASHKWAQPHKFGLELWLFSFKNEKYLIRSYIFFLQNRCLWVTKSPYKYRNSNNGVKVCEKILPKKCTKTGNFGKAKFLKKNFIFWFLFVVCAFCHSGFYFIFWISIFLQVFIPMNSNLIKQFFSFLKYKIEA